MKTQCCSIGIDRALNAETCELITAKLADSTLEFFWHDG
jgi:hypothetical protein